jgi:hypothetical protein
VCEFKENRQGIESPTYGRLDFIFTVKRHDGKFGSDDNLEDDYVFVRLWSDPLSNNPFTLLTK